MNQLYYGDNLHILHEHLANESIDLIYSDYEPDLNFKKAKIEAQGKQMDLMKSD
ncbi:MAG TPA: hypothetical protein VHG71_13605 [Verrucomicrobiae bacterium]|nr:hypothetical protein [Verrucomicrobiae bacterium]